MPSVDAGSSGRTFRWGGDGGTPSPGFVGSFRENFFLFSRYCFVFCRRYSLFPFSNGRRGMFLLFLLFFHFLFQGRISSDCWWAAPAGRTWRAYTGGCRQPDEVYQQSAREKGEGVPMFVYKMDTCTFLTKIRVFVVVRFFVVSNFIWEIIRLFFFLNSPECS